MNSEPRHSADTADIGVVIVHGVADTEQGANLDTLVNTMCASPRFGFKVDSYDQIHRLRDDPLDRLPETALVAGKSSGRPVIVRHGSINRANVAFAEVYWADTTRVNTGKFAALMAAFRVVFEAHYFIDALIDRSARRWRLARGLLLKCRLADAVALKWRLADLLALLLHLATGLIRGPIAGVNIALLSISAVYLYGQAILQLADLQSVCPVLEHGKNPRCVVVPLDISVLVVLCVLAAVSIRTFFKSRAKADVATLEVSVLAAPGIVVGAAAFAVVILYNRFFKVPVSKENVVLASEYATQIFTPLAYLWIAFGVLVFCAFVVVLCIVRTADSRTRRASWLALALVILQASLWSLFISAPSIPLLALGKLTDSLSPELQPLTYGFALNYLGIAVVGIIAGLVMLARSRAASAGRNSKPNPEEPLSKIRERQGPLQNIAKSLPRLIMNRNILIAIIALGLGQIAMQFAFWLSDTSLSKLLAGHLHASLWIVLLVASAALLLYLFIDTKTSVNFIHIARDLIDHHYKPRSSFVYWLLPAKHRKAPKYLRRQRLLSRLDAAVTFLEAKGCHAIVFVAHSQGSIIVYEYLKNLVAAEGSAHRRAVVTFGAPLDHLYAHYFHDYANVGETLIRLERCVASWINLHRIDDPIGNSIGDCHGWIDDIAMGKGGHINYWKEAAVAEAIEQSLDRLAGARVQ